MRIEEQSPRDRDSRGPFHASGFTDSLAGVRTTRDIKLLEARLDSTMRTDFKALDFNAQHGAIGYWYSAGSDSDLKIDADARN